LVTQPRPQPGVLWSQAKSCFSILLSPTPKLFDPDSDTAGSLPTLPPTMPSPATKIAATCGQLLPLHARGSEVGSGVFPRETPPHPWGGGPAQQRARIQPAVVFFAIGVWIPRGSSQRPRRCVSLRKAPAHCQGKEGPSSRQARGRVAAASPKVNAAWVREQLAAKADTDFVQRQVAASFESQWRLCRHRFPLSLFICSSFSVHLHQDQYWFLVVVW